MQTGTFQVSLRDGSGKVDLKAFPMHYSELALAEVPKKEAVYVLAGEYQGQTGVAKVVQNREAFVKLEGSNITTTFRLPKLAWVNRDSGK